MTENRIDRSTTIQTQSALIQQQADALKATAQALEPLIIDLAHRAGEGALTTHRSSLAKLDGIIGLAAHIGAEAALVISADDYRQGKTRDLERAAGLLDAETAEQLEDDRCPHGHALDDACLDCAAEASNTAAGAVCIECGEVLETVEYTDDDKPCCEPCWRERAGVTRADDFVEQFEDVVGSIKQFRADFVESEREDDVPNEDVGYTVGKLDVLTKVAEDVRDELLEYAEVHTNR